MTPQTVLDFWFAEENQPFWFQKSDDFDQTVRSRFAGLLAQAAQSELYRWRDSLHGRLAEIIVLDQFPRNLHRNSPAAFAHDNMAVALAQEAVRQSGFADMAERERHFMLMPLMHSESRIVHQQAEALFKQHTSDYAYQFELKHKVIIDRFGRYPHRNAVFGRPSSAEEIEFLKEPDSSF